ncbi:MAG: hypothetical protein GY870_05250 [archaeon]|nr:hypothetical protein [archaeon]
MLLESIFVVRGGFWGEEYDFKLLFAVVAMIICILDWKWKKRKDYFWVFLIGFIFWTSVELLLQFLGIRDMPNRYLFGISIPIWLSIPLQGMSEGVAVGIMGLFITDLYINKETRKFSLLTFLIVFTLITLIMFSHGVYIPDIGGDVPSRRDVFPIWELLIILLAAPAIFWFIKTDKKSRKRGFYMLFTMFILGCAWYLVYWLSGQRWVEIGIKNVDGTYSNLRRASPVIEFMVAIFNAFIEIALIYMPFLAIPYLLGFIRTINGNS